MQMHLYEAAQPNALSSQVGFQQLDTCMTIMKEFCKTYWAADFSLRIFSEALVKVRNRTRRLPTDNESTGERNRATTQPGDDTSFGASNNTLRDEHVSSTVSSGRLETFLQSPNEDLFSSSDLDFFKFPAADQAYE